MTGYDEALAWFRERGYVSASREDARHAATIVSALLAAAPAVPAGRDLTEQDVRDALATVGTFPCSGLDRVAEHLSRIARPPAPEPQAAEPPRFEREVESIASALWRLWGDVSPGAVTNPGPLDQRFSDLINRVRALVAAGAVREEGDQS